MPIKVYHDSSKGKTGGHPEVVTLTGFAGAESVWPEFEGKWGRRYGATVY